MFIKIFYKTVRSIFKPIILIGIFISSRVTVLLNFPTHPPMMDFTKDCGVNIMISTRFVFVLLGCLMEAISHAGPISAGAGAFLYDSGGLASTLVTDMNNFNSQNYGCSKMINPVSPSASPPTYPISRLYVYAQSITASTQTINYDYSKTSPYHNTVHISSGGDANVFAIIDSQDASDIDALSWDQGVALGQAIATHVCDDPNVVGVVLDIEGGKSHYTFKTGTGQSGLYYGASQGLQKCASGVKSMGVFANPNNIGPPGTPAGTCFQPGWCNWNNVKNYLGSNGYLIVGIYDVADGCVSPPPAAMQCTPSTSSSVASYSTPTGSFLSSITGKIQNMVTNSTPANPSPYTIAIPASASYSEFSTYFTPSYSCIPGSSGSGGAPFTAITQWDYIATSNTTILQNKGAGYLGVDYWQWANTPLTDECVAGEQFLPATPPNTPSDPVLGCLQNLNFGYH